MHSAAAAARGRLLEELPELTGGGGLSEVGALDLRALEAAGGLAQAGVDGADGGRDARLLAVLLPVELVPVLACEAGPEAAGDLQHRGRAFGGWGRGPEHVE